MFELFLNFNFVQAFSHNYNRIYCMLKGPALMVVWSKEQPLTASCHSPLPGFESQLGHENEASQSDL